MKKLIISLLFCTVILLSISTLIIIARDNQEVVVLIYHHILEEEYIKENGMTNNGSIISVESFKNQMDYLYNNNYNTITMSQLEDFLYENADLPEKSVLITFDDGYLSNYIYAYPILKEYGFHAAVFPTTVNISDEPVEFTPKKLVRFSWKEIKESKDVFEFGSHTHQMHAMEKGMPYIEIKNKEEVINDLTFSRQLLDNTNFFAYPYGEYSDESIQLLKEAGYKLAFTTKEGKVYKGSDPYKIKRYGIYPWTTIKEFKKIVK